jgi:hypothetical protein
VSPVAVGAGGADRAVGAEVLVLRVLQVLQVLVQQVLTVPC